MDQLHGPKSLKSLVSEIRYLNGNNLLHKFVLDNCKPNGCGNEAYIHGILRSLSGVPVNASNYVGFKALHLAVINRNHLLVKMLLSCLPNIDVNAPCKFQGQTALHLAASLTDWEEGLDKGSPNLKSNSESSNSGFQIEAKREIMDIIALLISSGADINARNKWNETPLHCAMRLKVPDIAELLISKGAEKNAIGNIGQTLLHWAVLWNQIDIAKLLISKGANVNVKDKNGQTPLHMAVRRYMRFEIAEVLVEAGALVNVKNKDCVTPLQYAEKLKVSRVADFLISEGANLNAVNDKGETPLHIGRRFGRLENVNKLKEHGHSN